MEKRYQVFVYENNKNPELVDSFQTLEEARNLVSKFETNKAEQIEKATELSYHYRNLSWKVVDMGGKDDLS